MGVGEGWIFCFWLVAEPMLDMLSGVPDLSCPIMKFNRKFNSGKA